MISNLIKKILKILKIKWNNPNKAHNDKTKQTPNKPLPKHHNRPNNNSQKHKFLKLKP